jgi:hypothetical protein
MQFADIFDLNQVFELAQGFSIDQDLSALCLVAEARRKIGDGAHRAVVEPSFKTNRADSGITLSDADADR